MSKTIDLAKKLKALSDRGVGGEKNNAVKMLDALMKKHNLTIEDIEGEEKVDYYLKMKGDEIKLFNQIAKKVNIEIVMYGEFPKNKIKQFKLAGNYCMTCTASEYIEIISMHSVYKRLLEEEMDIFYTAFCKSNNLLIDSPQSKKMSELSQKEKEDWLRITQMADSIKKETFRKQLPNPSS